MTTQNVTETPQSWRHILRIFKK